MLIVKQKLQKIQKQPLSQIAEQSRKKKIMDKWYFWSTTCG